MSAGFSGLSTPASGKQQTSELQTAEPAPLKIMLAPMEGVVDAAMRELLTGLGGYSRCVTEFVRVTDVLLPDRVFYRYCPELHNGGLTATGVPVYVQLLGSNPEALAENAMRAAALGAPGIDLNFGCPAKTVNRHQGGSILLREPERVAQIVRAVRDAVPAHIPVCAKIRLGYESADLVLDIASGIEEAGATELCIHARTKMNGYKPPAYWSEVLVVAETLTIPVIINGEIWSVEDCTRARLRSGCSHVMLGRGALSCPDLALQIRASDAGDTVAPLHWLQVLESVEQQFERSCGISPRHIGNRTKQWLGYLRREYREAAELFRAIKKYHDPESIRACIQQQRLTCRDAQFSANELVAERTASGLAR